jgi:hypothetical protein
LGRCALPSVAPARRATWRRDDFATLRFNAGGFPIRVLRILVAQEVELVL